MSKELLVTGSSTGFGAGVAIAMAARGWRVFASMRDMTKAPALLEQADKAGVASRIVPLRIDVTDAASVDAGVAEVLEATGGRIDAVLSNAGYSVLGAFEDVDDKATRAQMETNFFGALAVARAVLPAMRQAQAGRIVIVSSNAVNTPHPLLSTYAASKWALEGWAEALAMELAPFGIGVSVVQPGAHRTPFAGNVQFVAPDESPYRQWMQTVMPGIGELDRWGRDPDLAIPPIVAALENPQAAFRIAIGEDTQVFSALKGAAPYEVRAFALRAITGAPGPDAFVNRPSPGTEAWPVASEVLGRVAQAVASDPAAGATLAKAFGLTPRVVKE